MKTCKNCYYWDKIDCLPKEGPICQNGSKWRPKHWDGEEISYKVIDECIKNKGDCEVGKSCSNCRHGIVHTDMTECKILKVHECYEMNFEYWVNNKTLIDNINNPQHYVGKIETIDYIEDKLTIEEFKGALKYNILKYISREKKKNGLEDVKKAEYCVKKLIKVMEGEAK